MSKMRSIPCASHFSGARAWSSAPLKWSGLVFLLALVGGCAYSVKTLYPEQYHTIAVPVFENRTFYQGVNASLGEALVKRIEQQTPYKVVAPGTADTILEGTITSISQTQLSRRRRGAGGLPQELEVTVICDWQWKDLRSGELIRQRKGFAAVGSYIPTSPVGEPVDIALQQAVDRMATDITNTLQADW